MGLLTGITDEGVNFADVDTAGDFEALPTGWYHACITDAQDTDEDGNPRLTSADSAKYPNVGMLNVEWTIQDGEYENRRVWNNYLMHEDFLGYLKQLLIGCGEWTEEEVNDPDFDFEAVELIGAEHDLKVQRYKQKKGQYKGEWANRIGGFAKPGTKSAKSGGDASSGLLPE